MTTQRENSAPGNSDKSIVDELVRAAGSLRFGQIVLTIHNSRIVQIDKTEKIRLDLAAGHDKGSGI
jgi:hypothetical protein